MTPTGDGKRPKSPAKRPARTPAAARERPRSGRGGAAKQELTDAGTGERGILSNLPSTRPQRPSARRAAAKRAAAERVDPPATKRAAAKRVGPTPAKRPAASAQPGSAPAKRPAASAQPDSTTTKRRAATKRRAPTKRSVPNPSSIEGAAAKHASGGSAKSGGGAPKLPPPPIPPQGFETEDEIAPGTPVEPPSRPEVAGALAELVGELAQTGIARGGRLLKDALGRLPSI